MPARGQHQPVNVPLAWLDAYAKDPKAFKAIAATVTERIEAAELAEQQAGTRQAEANRAADRAERALRKVESEKRALAQRQVEHQGAVDRDQAREAAANAALVELGNELNGKEQRLTDENAALVADRDRFAADMDALNVKEARLDNYASELEARSAALDGREQALASKLADLNDRLRGFAA